MEVAYRLRVTFKSDYEHILQHDPYPDPIDVEARVAMLNADQRHVYFKITSHLLHLQKHEKQECACTELKPLNMFVSGVGGTRMSQAIRAFVRAIWPHRQHHCSGFSHGPGSLQCEWNDYVPVVPFARWQNRSVLAVDF